MGSKAFTGAGFKNWKKMRERMKVHVGPVGSVHNKVREAATNLMNQNTHIETVMGKRSKQARMAYRRCLIASIKCTKFLLKQGLSFRGNDENATSSNSGNYLELLQFLADNDEKLKKLHWKMHRGISMDEARDVSVKEQMAVVLRYVDDKGHIIEKLRGQGYNGASNMRALVTVARILILPLSSQPLIVWLTMLEHFVSGVMHLDINSKKIL
ncbi:hypothetical protein L3X38_031170 [Prunus dulcis]|uniref:DUF4371 domain-containing protein n=1 Tax=Prunus dulcis TaxID=3755 RepID=A0AAD4VBZ5_PRUDU|nr:hypothetical protein L3X38_031170 [Prunus dulcis]